MKKLLIIFLTALLSTATVTAQERTITKADFEAVYQPFSQSLRTKPNREIRTSSMEMISPAGASSNAVSSTGAATDNGSRTVIERVPGVGQHVMDEVTANGRSVKFASIRLNKKLYNQVGEGEWAVVPDTPPPFLGTPAEYSDNLKVEYKFLGAENLEGRETTVYWERLTTPVSNNRAIVSETKYWFGRDGMLIKRETISQTPLGGSIMKDKSSATFEFDPAIKIIAPKIKKTSR